MNRPADIYRPEYNIERYVMNWSRNWIKTSFPFIINHICTNTINLEGIIFSMTSERFVAVWIYWIFL